MHEQAQRIGSPRRGSGWEPEHLPPPSCCPLARLAHQEEQGNDQTPRAEVHRAAKNSGTHLCHCYFCSSKPMPLLVCACLDITLCTKYETPCSNKKPTSMNHGPENESRSAQHRLPCLVNLLGNSNYNFRKGISTSTTCPVLLPQYRSL